MSANLQSNPRLWCHLMLKVAMLYGVRNAPLWRRASTFHPLACVRVQTHVCLCECFHVHMCVWLVYRVCLHYTLFRLIWLTLNRYWFPLLCSFPLSFSPCLPLSLAAFLLSPPSLSHGSVPASAKQDQLPFTLISFLHLSLWQTEITLAHDGQTFSNTSSAKMPIAKITCTPNILKDNQLMKQIRDRNHDQSFHYFILKAIMCIWRAATFI